MTPRARLNRRALLRATLGGAIASALVAACGSPVPSSKPSDAAPAAKPAAPTTAPAAAPTIAPAATSAAAAAPTTAPAATSAPAAATSAPAAAATKPAAAVPTAQPAAGRQPVTVEFWAMPGTDVGAKEDQESVVALFAKSPAGETVKVNMTAIPESGYDDKMNTGLATGSGLPDVGTIGNADWFPKIAGLKDYIARDKVDLGQYSKSHFDIHCRFLDQIIALPMGIGATMYFYNTTLFDAKGLKAPQWGYTIDQFLGDALKMSDRPKKIYGSFRQQTIWRGEFFAFGARPFSEDGTKADGFMNSPKTVRAFEFMYDWLTSDAVPTSAENDALKTEGTGPLDLFSTGRLGFGALNNGQFQVVDKAGVKFGLVHQPMVQGEDVWNNGWTTRIGIPGASKVKDGAWEWLKFFTGEGGQKQLMSLNHGFTPVIPELWKSHPAASDPRIQFFFKINSDTKQVREFLFKFPYVGKVTRLNQDLYDQIYLKKIGKADIKKTLDATVPQAQKVIDEERAKLKLWIMASRAARREAIEGYLGISPWLIGFVVFTAGPMLASLYLSLTDWRMVDPPNLIGLKNYVKIFTDDPDFLRAIRVTFTYVLMALPLQLALGLGLSLLLNQGVPGIRLFRTIFYIPAVLSGVSVALVWMWLLNPDFGIVNALLGLFGIEGPGWFWDPDWALASIVVIGLWRVGGGAIIYLAGLQNISPHLYEAAQIDGAGALARLRHVTLPMLTPTLFFQLVMELIDAFQVFTAVWVTTAGGPVGATFFYMLFMYRTAFVDFDMAYASALAWIMGTIILALTALVFKSSALWVFYESEGRG